MSTVKRILCPARLRRVPHSFSWIDHRLVRDGYLGHLGHEAQALYLFLITVSDGEGLSYYSDAKVCALLNMSESQLYPARRQLVKSGLIAYSRPLYQVLSLDDPDVRFFASEPVHSSGGAVAISEVVRQLMPECGEDRGGAQ